MEESDLKLITKALAFAADKHKNQRRKDAEASPYINHPVGLANVLANEGHITDINIICGALLHDTVEDTETTHEELQDAFGTTIKGIVMEVTDDKALPKQERKQAQVDHAPHLSTQAKAIKLADKICNLRDVSSSPPPDWSIERRQNYYDWAKKVIDGLRGEWPELESIFYRQYEDRPNL